MPAVPCHRLALIGLVLGLVAASCKNTPTGPQEAEPEWELWPNRDALPNFETDVIILPNLHPDSPPIGFPLSGTTVFHDGVEWLGVQWGRDVRIAKTVPVNRWLFGVLGDGWWTNTVNIEAQLRATRLVAIEIDGERIPVTVDDIFAYSVEGFDVAFYNIFPRFKTTGLHSLKYIWRQDAYFFFHYPHERIPIFPDQWPEFEQRRVFVPEVIGDPVDGEIIFAYTLNVVEE